MNNINANSDTGFTNNKPKIRFTPRELIHRHMENPDEPITDADIENLYLGERKSDVLDTQYNTNSTALTEGETGAAKN